MPSLSSKSKVSLERMIYRSMIIMPFLKIKMQTMVRVSYSCMMFVIFEVNIKDI